MKAEFELRIAENGEPEIHFKHHDKDGSIEQKLLQFFIKKGLSRGLKLQLVSGSIGPGYCFDRYKIIPCRKNEGDTMATTAKSGENR